MSCRPGELSYHRSNVTFSYLQLVDGEQRMSSLQYAALSGCVETVSCLLHQLRADPNLLSSNGHLALYAALQSGDVDCVEMLIGVTNKGDHHTTFDNIQQSTVFRIGIMCCVVG